MGFTLVGDAAEGKGMPDYTLGVMMTRINGISGSTGRDLKGHETIHGDISFLSYCLADSK